MPREMEEAIARAGERRLFAVACKPQSGGGGAQPRALEPRLPPKMTAPSEAKTVPDRCLNALHGRIRHTPGGSP